MNREPLAIRAAIVAVVTAVLGLLVAAGVAIPADLSSNAETVTLVVISVVAPLVTAALARGKVTPVDDSGYTAPTDREV